MPKLTLDLDALKVQTLALTPQEPRQLDYAATANTCYKSCLVTACLC